MPLLWMATHRQEIVKKREHQVHLSGYCTRRSAMFLLFDADALSAVIKRGR